MFAFGCGLIPLTYSLPNAINLVPLGRIDNSIMRKIDHPLEIFMPPVEIDKVARAFVHLQVKGRRLVKEVKES